MPQKWERRNSHGSQEKMLQEGSTGDYQPSPSARPCRGAGEGKWSWETDCPRVREVLGSVKNIYVTRTRIPAEKKKSSFKFINIY